MLGSSNVTGINFGAFTPPSSFNISGTVFNDVNNNGQFDLLEPGLSGVTVFADLNDDGIMQTNEPHAVSNGFGNYSLTVLTPGSFVIRQVVPSGNHQTDPSNGDGVHATLNTIANVPNINFGDTTADGTISEADMNVISGSASDPNNSSTTLEVKFVISGGPTQIILANQANHDFTYTTPVLSVGPHAVQIFTINPNTNVTTLLATRTVTSQNSLFDEHYYLETNPDVAAAVKAGEFATGYDHYIEFGQFEGRNPSPYWSEPFYLEENPDVATAVHAGLVSSGFMQFYNFGQFENRPGLLYFNQTFYLANNPDVAAAIALGAPLSPFEHFVLYGQYERRSPMKYFSATVYDADNSDIISTDSGESFSTDFEQFVEVSQFEGRVASNFYNETTYLADNADVAAAVRAGEFPDGFVHWLEFGQFENRRAI
jgi:hypothetical protein